MGYYEHKAFIVTGEGDHFERAYTKAKELFKFNELGEEVNLVSSVCCEMNSYNTFIVAPDGSKEGCATSEFFDTKIEEMVKYLKSRECTFDDGSSFNSWVLVRYGDTGRRVLKSNCRNMF